MYKLTNVILKFTLKNACDTLKNFNKRKFNNKITISTSYP